MDFSFDLRKWSEFNSTTPTVLTVYLDTHHKADLKFLHRKGKEIESLYHDDREIRENFLKALRQVRKYCKEEDLPHQGMCFFVDPSQKLFHTYELPRDVGDLVILDTSPYIRPLAQLKEDWEPFGLVMMDHGQAHLYLIYLSHVQDEKELKTQLLAHQKNGGWSQGRYSRRRKNRIADFLREVSKDLSGLLRKERVNRIILAGSAEAKKQLVEYLPQDLQRKVVGFLDLTMDTDEKTLFEKSFPIFFAAEKIEENKMVLDLRDQIASQGLGVAGVEAVAQAVVAGRVEKVLVHADLKPKGWKCERCDVMEEGEAETCILCDERVFPVDLVEEIVEYAQKTDAEVIFFREGHPILEGMGGIGAFLRF